MNSLLKLPCPTKRTGPRGQRSQLLGRKKQAEEAACGKFQLQNMIMFSSPTYPAAPIFSLCLPQLPFYRDCLFLNKHDRFFHQSASSWLIFCFQRLVPTLSSFALVVVAVCPFSSLTPRLPLPRIWRAEGKHCFVLGVPEARCQELILAPSEPPDPLFLLFSRCSLNPSQVCGLWWWVTRWRAGTASPGAGAGPLKLSRPAHASTVAHTNCFSNHWIVHLLIRTSRLWAPWSQRSSEFSSDIEHLL